MGATAALWLAMAGATLTAASAACPSEEWIPYDGNCYWKTPFDTRWLSGEDICNTAFPGSHMASIHDSLENAFIYEYVANFTSTWIGFRRYDDDVPWSWSDGSPANWTNWCDGQPFGYGERFGYMAPDHHGCWMTSNTSGDLPLVCKTPEQNPS